MGFTKIQAVSFQHPLWAETISLSEEDTVELIERHRKGRKLAGQQLVKGHLALALTIVGQYVALFKSRRFVDDFVSAAMVGLADGVEKLREPPDGNDNPQAIIAAFIHRAITDYIESLPTVKVPSRSERRGKAIPTRVYDDAENERLIDSGVLEEISPVEEMIDSVVQSELEANIVRLRVEGYTDDEIGAELGYSRQTVQVIRQDLHERLKVLLPERKPQ